MKSKLTVYEDYWRKRPLASVEFEGGRYETRIRLRDLAREHGAYHGSILWEGFKLPEIHDGSALRHPLTREQADGATHFPF